MQYLKESAVLVKKMDLSIVFRNETKPDYT